MAYVLIPGVGVVYDPADGSRILIPGAGVVGATPAAGGGATYTLTAATGSFTLTGNAAALSAARKMTAADGSFTLTGNATGLTVARKLIADTGVFTLTGNAANLVYTPVGGPTYTLTASGGSFTVSENTTGLYVARKLAADTGAFTLTGNSAMLMHGVGTVARPNTDTTPGAWLPSSGSALYAMVDEVTPDDADYIYATTASACELALTAVTDPATSSGQVVSYRAWSPTGDGLTVKLKQGAATIATWTHATLSTSATTYQQALSGAECDAITDYAALAVEMTALI